MRRAALLLALFALAGCGHTSHLSADDQQFCSSLSADPIKTLRGDVDHLTSNNHFASAGDAMAFAAVDLGKSDNVLRNANLQDSGLAQMRDATTSSLLDLGLGVNSQSTAVDQDKLQAVHGNLASLQDYCDTH